MPEGEDTLMPDASTANSTLLTEKELDEKYPNRPRNHSKTLPFHDLFLTLFNPLNENKKKPAGPVVARRKVGRHGPHNLTPHEARRNIIEQFIQRWRNEVGDDIYPAFRLILPDKDRERPMYGLKEKAIGRILVKVMRINKDSSDGYRLLNWKLPGQTIASRMAGDFAGTCFEVISKRPMRADVGNMTIEEVNSQLDRLCMAHKEDDQLPIFQQFYNNMNADELLWVIRIILRQMKVGATERTFFDVWHPDATSLFNVSSSLRRVCWELYDPKTRLEGDDRGIALMQCFQPQLAQFQMHSFQKMVEKMRPTEDDDAFWIEEKLDGERMQLHMVSDEKEPGGKRFTFWSRKAKDYTYLYGRGFYDDRAALTRHLVNAFHEGVDNIILDGEMITWDMEQDSIVPFGTLKTAALEAQRNPFSTTGQRPLFRIFDLLYLNGKPLTNYTLRDRRKALEAAVRPVHRHFEIHSYHEAHSASEIEPMLRKVVEEASEGLVLKNPRSAYRLNERNDDWMKVKPEYMTEFGESLDCIVIGGYYGSGHRGGRLSSFLCGLRVDENQVSQGVNPMKCYSFFKVGGGMTAADYAAIRHRTDGKWKDWDAKRPPTEFIELAGGDLQYEKPDVWIRPDESVVLEVKAASVTITETFRMGFTLRFPRFTRLRDDKDWTSALTMQEFARLKDSVEREHKEKAFEVDNSRRAKRQRTTTKKKKTLAIAGNESPDEEYGGEHTNVFSGLSFYVMSESVAPQKLSKSQLEQLIKAHGGRIYQSPTSADHMICIADKRVVKVAALLKQSLDKYDIVRPAWIFACIEQALIDKRNVSEESGQSAAAQPIQYVLPLEPRWMFHVTPSSEERVQAAVDCFGDSYANDVTPAELRQLILDEKASLIPDPPSDYDPATFRAELARRGRGSLLPGRAAAISTTTTDGDDDKMVVDHNESKGQVDNVSSSQIGRGWLFEGLRMYFCSLDDESEENDFSFPRSPQDQSQEQKPTTTTITTTTTTTTQPLSPAALRLFQARITARFAGATLADTLEDDDGVTHIVICEAPPAPPAPLDHTRNGNEYDTAAAAAASERARRAQKLASLRRRTLAAATHGGHRRLMPYPRTVGVGWLEKCWAEGTRVDEERFAGLRI